MAEDQLALALTPAWTRSGTGRKFCSRNPDAGPGSCWLWWEGCPKAEKAGCYQLWFHQQEKTHG